MIYIFSSAYYDLFKQNVLNASCYPDGHVMRLRYDAKYIEPAARKNPDSIKDKEAVLVFAEGSIANRDAVKGGGQARDYWFYPLRRCTVSAASAPADIFIVDVKLGSFVDYQDGPASRDQQWDGHIKALAARPWPKNFRTSSTEEGFYLFSGDSLPLIDDRRELELAWRSVVERANESELKECITYRVLGFYRRGWWNKEKLIKPKVDGPDALYAFRSGETVLLKLLFYGDANRKGDAKSLRLEFDSKAFTSASVSTVLVNGHYNEERILLPCARTTDPLITSLGLVQNQPKDGVWSPQPTFMVKVAPRTLYLLAVVLVFAFSFLFGSLGKFSELWKEINWADPGSIGDHLAKPAAGFLFLLASWLYLRKFPLK
ncbi:MAG: hypothetical protein IT165_01455 [Bryobacterales bacterium]|nr:hypothetical protein [Bryobacterales bacterium]